MKKYKIYWLMFVALGMFACAENNEIGEIPVLTTEYKLPQGKSPADDRIVDLFDKYGTYVLYDFTDADLKWVQVGITNYWNAYRYTAPDPKYAGNMLDLLDKIWFKFYPEDFHKKFMPYKIFLVSTLQYVDNYSGNTIDYASRVVQTQMIIANCSDELVNMPDETKLALKKSIQAQLWGNWLGRFTIPKEFYEVSNYYGAASSDPDDWNYARERGFVVDNEGFEWSTSLQHPATTLNESRDLDAFLSGMRNRTSEQWAEDLKYPLVKKKYDILRNYFLEKFSFDIQSIGDATTF